MSFKRPASLGPWSVIVLLTACGGGGGSDPPNAQQGGAPVLAQSAPETAPGNGTQPPVEAAPPVAESAPSPDAQPPVADAAPADNPQAQDIALAPDLVTQSGPSSLQRAAAASATAQSASNACAIIRPFYWELGDKNARIAGGSVYASGSKAGYTAITPLSIASSSKWMYAAYVAQKQAGVLSASDRRHLSMQSGYVSMSTTSCQGSTTVDGCLAAGSNGAYTKAADGRFDYNSGHMEKHASLIGLGALDNAGLAKALRSQIGSDVDLSFSRPLLAGGMITTSDAYARFLRKVLAGQLRIGSLLGTTPVCTNRSTCSTALFTPVPNTENWHYSVGHWVEDDAKVGDGAFSSPGAFGFYPWIDAGKTSYGIVGRMGPEGSGDDSVRCGRIIRKAWLTGVAM